MMKDPCSALAEYFEEKGWEHQIRHDGHAIHTRHIGAQGDWHLVVLVSDYISGMLFYSLLPARAPVGRRAACLELLNHINQDGWNGTFEMVPENGLIRYRTYLPVFGELVSQEAIDRQFKANVEAVNRHFGAIMRVVCAGMDAAEALKEPGPEVEAVRRRFEWN